MTRGRELAIRAGVTVGIAALFVLALSTSRYTFHFEKVWAFRGLYLKGVGMTLAATAVAYAIGLTLGVFVALARLSPRLWIRHIGDLYVEVVRGTPVLVQLMIAYFGVAPLLGVNDKFAVGAVTLGVFAAAYVGEIFRAGIESIDRGQFEAGRSLGLSRGQTLRHVVMPQAFKRMIPPLTGELIALTKESSLLWAIGIVEVLAAAKQAGAHSYAYLEAFLLAAAFYLALTIPLSLLSRRLERRLGRSAREGVAL
jgi:polar amino acid transport system permease protein